jgi:CBS domain-containing protein
MPFTVHDLISDKIKPVTTGYHDSAKDAVNLMMERDFSQLPVLNDRDRLVGMVTSDSIVRALNHLKLKIEDLKVEHATKPIPKTFTPDDEIFDLLDELRDAYALVVVDKEEHVLGIVTNYDTATYFRARAEDMMLVEDVENTLKDCIRIDLAAKQGDLEDFDLKVTVGDAEDGKVKEGYHRTISKALELLNLQPSNSQKGKLQKLVEDQFANRPPKAFADLTLQQYISLFLEKGRWDRYCKILQLPIEACRTLLESVRLTRNDLFHFRTELSADRREALRYCRDLLNRHQQAIIEALRPEGVRPPEAVTVEEALDQDLTSEPEDIRSKLEEMLSETPQLIENSTSETSKYETLATFLQTLPSHISNVVITLEEIESIIEGELPRTAYEHRAWWANDSVSHVQSKQWLEVGWRVSSVNISQQRVTFSRIRDREQKYISFFSDLLTRLQDRRLAMRPISPTGRNYIPMDFIANEKNEQITFIGCSFARGDLFRVELYIDTGNHVKNEIVFLGLQDKKDMIEASISSPIKWESLENRRGSRIAVYHPGSITDSDELLSALCGWAVETIIQFYETFQDGLREEIIKLESGAREIADL